MGLCFLYYYDFDNFTMPACLLWTLMLLKQCSTDEASAAWTRAREDTFRDWVSRTLTDIIDAKFSSVAHNHITTVLKKKLD